MPKDGADSSKPGAVALAPLLAGQRMLGVVKNYNGSTGFGFITCAETQQLFKRDVFLQRQEVVASGAKVGSTVSFTIDLNKDGKPQARSVEVVSPNDKALKPSTQASGDQGPGAAFQEMLSSVDEYVEGIVSESQHFTGYVKSFSKESGFGFVACDDTHRIFGRDVFLHQSSLGDFKIGDAIVFRLEIDPQKGTPRAKDLIRAPAGAMDKIQSGEVDPELWIHFAWLAVQHSPTKVSLSFLTH
jgi:cold shock CspA family protein